MPLPRPPPSPFSTFSQRRSTSLPPSRTTYTRSIGWGSLASAWETRRSDGPSTPCLFSISLCYETELTSFVGRSFRSRFWLLTTLISLSHLSVSTPALTRRIEALEHARFTASGGLLELPSGSSSQAETDKLKAERDEERWTALKLCSCSLSARSFRPAPSLTPLSPRERRDGPRLCPIRHHGLEDVPGPGPSVHRLRGSLHWVRRFALLPFLPPKGRGTGAAGTLTRRWVRRTERASCSRSIGRRCSRAPERRALEHDTRIARTGRVRPRLRLLKNERERERVGGGGGWKGTETMGFVKQSDSVASRLTRIERHGGGRRRVSFGS